MTGEFTIRRHVPNFIDGVDEETCSFSTQGELERIEFVRRHVMRSVFTRLSVGTSNGSPILISEHNDGYEWWVVGYLSGTPEWLPKWSPKYKNSKEDRAAKRRE
jgi:hypothetical protein